MPSPDDDKNPFDEFGEPTIKEIRAPVSTSIKPEVAAALAALKPARPTTSPSLPPPSSLPPSPSSSSSSSSSSFSTPRPRPTTSPSMAPPVRTPTGSVSVPPATASSNASWQPPRFNFKPIFWGVFVVGAAGLCFALLRSRPPSTSTEPGTPVSVFDHEALACTRVTARGQRVECAFTPQQLGKLDESERRSRLEAARKQAGAAGYTGVVLVDNGRVWRVLHAEEVELASDKKPR